MNSKLVNILATRRPKTSRRLAFWASLAGLLQALVVVIINLAAQKIGQETDVRLLLLFVLCITGFIVAKRLTLFGAAEYIYRIVYEIRLRVVDKVRKAETLPFERIGKDAVATTITKDTEVIIEAAKSLSHAFSAAVMLFFSFIYILVLSVQAFFLTLGLLAIGVYIYLSTNTRIGPKLRQAGEVERRFHGYLWQLLNGFKETKMSRAKGRAIFEDRIRASSDSAKADKLAAEYLLINNNFFVQVFFFMLIAAVVFVLPQFVNQNATMFRDLIAVLLFCIGSIVSVVQVIPILSKADAALAQLFELEQKLDQADDSRGGREENPFAGGGAFNGIELKDVAFSYQGEENGNNGNAFHLGPLELSIRPGQMIFLTGGNGGGKSTLLKIIAGLYYPDRGDIRADGVLVERANYSHYRELFSILFSDFHLFDELYGVPRVDEAEVARLLAELGLAGATSYRDGRFSNLKLSSGQKKRLAVIAACVEQRPVFLFDEVAADLDPVFREYFYGQFLPGLRDRGKTIICATHDDRYFHLADTRLKLEFGRRAE